MQITLLQINRLFIFLQKLNNKYFPLKTNYKLAKLKFQINLENNFYLEKVQEYINIYSEKDDNNNPKMTENGIIIRQDKISECNQKIQELNNMEVSIEEIKIPLSDLDKAELNLEEMEILLPFIEEDK